MSRNNAPYTYEAINLVKGSLNPSAIHTRNTGLFRYYVKYLFQKIVSVFKFTGLPEYWSENYFKYVLLGYGFISIFDDKEYGVIPQQCTLSDNITLFYQPKYALITNPVLKYKQLEIGKECELIKLMPDYSNPMDLVSTYADLLAIAMETTAVNLMNSKASFIFFAENEAIANTYKALYDEISAGKPFSVVAKELKNEDGSNNWDFFTQNVGQNYITDRILNDMKTIEDQFNTKIGIPNANTQKRERLINSEVQANDIDTQALIRVWLDSMKDGIAKVNKHYGLNISVDYNYDSFYNKEGEVDYGSEN